MRKHIYTLLSLLVAAFLIVVILVLTAPAPNKQPNGFKRDYLQPSALSTITKIPTGNNILDIIGADDSLFYFSITGNPSMVIASTLKADAGIDTLRLPVPASISDSVSEYFFSQRCNDRFIVFGYNIPSIYSMHLSDTSRHTYAVFSRGGFSQGYALRDGKHFVLRKLHIEQKDQLFIRVNLDNDSILTENSLSELHRDGGMSTDGSLTYDRSTGLFTYIYYYSNRFFTFDSTLQRVNNGHTIDTFATSRFTLATNKDESGQVYMNAGPDMMVNGFSCADNGILYVQAKLKADNDEDALFGAHTVIDLYEISSGKYIGSYYLNIPARTRINQLFVQRDKLIVHSADHIFAIQLPD
ncbi:hypothetical protein [Chitinophaga agri]|uniref:Uncharacterized protein n=1 Tax=Chitinophaga agri TaxID=2703787 RepID=A0A6B9ZBB6_9BACT|nr:hypothetical protein [Chitinophaga agri]QHS59600.1 hypothetical protein GWR21_08360 [Chitinophaga agri]